MPIGLPSTEYIRLYKTKDVEVCISCSFPRIEAFALPGTVGTSNEEAPRLYE